MQRNLWSAIAQTFRFDGLFWRKFMYLGCVYGPEWWKRYSPPVWAALFFVLVGRNRRGSADNMARVLGERSRPWATLAAFRMWADFSHCMTETMEYFGPRPKPIRLDLPEQDDLVAALREGRGAVIVTGHFGNWDIAAKTLCNYGRPVNIVMAREANVTTQEYVRIAREQAGVRILYSDNSVFSSLNMLRALKRNEIVAIQLDRPLPDGAVRHVAFFGVPAPFSAGPFVLARLSGAPLVPTFIPRLGTRHYAVRTCGRIHVPRERGDTHGLDRVMTEVVRTYEGIVREFPTQWFQFAPYWPDQVPASTAEPAARDEARLARH